MSDWRALQAARKRRELKRATESLQHLGREVRVARNERDAALRSPLLALKREAISYLAGRVSDAMAKASDVRVRESIAEIERAALASAVISVEGSEWDMMTVFKVEIPRSAYHFVADVEKMVRFP